MASPQLFEIKDKKAMMKTILFLAMLLVGSWLEAAEGDGYEPNPCKCEGTKGTKRARETTGFTPDFDSTGVADALARKFQELMPNFKDEEIEAKAKSSLEKAAKTRNWLPARMDAWVNSKVDEVVDKFKENVRTELAAIPGRVRAGATMAIDGANGLKNAAVPAKMSLFSKWLYCMQPDSGKGDWSDPNPTVTGLEQISGSATVGFNFDVTLTFAVGLEQGVIVSANETVGIEVSFGVGSSFGIGLQLEGAGMDGTINPQECAPPEAKASCTPKVTCTVTAEFNWDSLVEINVKGEAKAVKLLDPVHAKLVAGIENR